jgi:hypothetical protein
MARNPEEQDRSYGEALDVVGPTVERWIKEMFKGFDLTNISKPQKDLIQGLTVETMLYNSLMSNDEIVAVLAGIIRNVATRHSYANALDWGRRAEMFEKLKPGG